MASLVSTIKAHFNYVIYDLADPRTSNWFLVDGVLPVTSLATIYLLFVLKLGPLYMQNRKPFQIKNTLIVYNFIQVLLSTYIFYESLDAAWLRGYSLKCEPVDRTTSPSAMRVARGVYVFYLAKVSELLDTVFFVLRKKSSQVTFLHLYHHTFMLYVGWIGARFVPGGHLIFMGLINSFVHIIMYTYYMLAAMGPEYQKYLWWKKHITLIQMIQFLMIFVHSSQLIWTNCGYPRGLAIIALPNAVLFYNMFSNFYKKAYLPKESSNNNVSKKVS
ncbi:elongation of very long chain fatty acids protein-like [Aethina tumida]|uniref:elongation of very long chain fatty acids protein-like n=1 Tax=Aethina tumida TaxID=116153 RepID=UPI00096AEB99|nr:elongation of very long chain fatty acids protein-like [Aethina tumida]XP_019870261.1 elongation of very long chain fatty acids protein-like [Aethina tumida]